MNNITQSTNKDELITAAFEAIDSYQAQVTELQQKLRISIYGAVTLFLLGVIF